MKFLKNSNSSSELHESQQKQHAVYKTETLLLFVIGFELFSWEILIFHMCFFFALKLETPLLDLSLLGVSELNSKLLRAIPKMQE